MAIPEPRKCSGRAPAGLGYHADRCDHSRSPLPEPTADQRAHSEKLLRVDRVGDRRQGRLDSLRPLHAAGAVRAGSGLLRGRRAQVRRFGEPAETSSRHRKSRRSSARRSRLRSPRCSSTHRPALSSSAPDQVASRSICCNHCDDRGVPCQRYAIVEVSADLRERQQMLLAGEPVEWLTAAPADFAGVMLANEVLDVMPVRLFVKRGGTVAERGVGTLDGRFRFVERAAPPDLVAAVADIEREAGELARRLRLGNRLRRASRG